MSTARRLHILDTKGTRKMTSHLPAIDWVKIQEEYESTPDSTTQIARRWGLSDSTVSVRATRCGWVRDPIARARVTAQREALLMETAEKHRQEVIAVSAHVQAQVLTGHRKDIARARKLVSSLLDELSDMTEHKSTFEELGELMHAPDERGRDKLNKMYQKVISLPERGVALNTLSAALKTLIMLERQAYHIDGALVDPETPKDTAEVVRGLDKIMDKFNQVLSMQVESSSPTKTTTEVIIDVSARAKESTSNSPV